MGVLRSPTWDIFSVKKLILFLTPLLDPGLWKDNLKLLSLWCINFLKAIVVNFYNFRKSTNLIHVINRIKKKNYVIISINVDKAFDKPQYLFMIKTLSN